MPPGPRPPRHAPRKPRPKRRRSLEPRGGLFGRPTAGGQALGMTKGRGRTRNPGKSGPSAPIQKGHSKGKQQGGYRKR